MDETNPPPKTVKKSPRPKRYFQNDPSQNEAEVVNLFGEEAAHQSTPGDTVPEPGRKDGTPRVSRKYAMGDRWSRLTESVKNGEFTWDEFVSELSPTELARGQIKDKNGNFSGRPPSWVPRAFLNACMKELLKRGNTLYKENYVQAVDMMMKIGSDETVKPETRLKALQFAIERIEGKIPERVEVTVDDPWQTVLTGVVAEATEDAAVSRAHEYLARQDALKGFTSPDDEG